MEENLVAGTFLLCWINYLNSLKLLSLSSSIYFSNQQLGNNSTRAYEYVEFTYREKNYLTE